jgi:glyoxylase-like metal-dependent hydrolase (beta-lactamase superfamily II)
MTSELEIRRLVVGPIQGSCYLVRCDDSGRGLVIDPGDDADRIVEALREMKVEPEAILLTHGHFDHANAAGELRRRLRARVVCHPAEAELLRNVEEPTLFGIRRNPTEIDQQVGEGDSITVGECKVEVLHTPGHTPGGVCYVLGDTVFTGDLIFQGSVGRTDLPGGSDRDLAASLRRIAGMPAETRLLPGHGPATTVGGERGRNPYL